MTERLRIGLAAHLAVGGTVAAWLFPSLAPVDSSRGYSPATPLITWPETTLHVVLFVEPVDRPSYGAGIYDAQGISTQITSRHFL